jgi:Fur family ferric uptake transcriptional regulator
MGYGDMTPLFHVEPCRQEWPALANNLPILNVDDAKSILRQADLRCTAARIAVLQQLADENTPLSHSEVTQKLGQFGFDPSTIYRCLHEMAESGVLSRLDLGDQVRRFEMRSPQSQTELDHPHFMCVDCGKIICLSDFSVRLTPNKGRRRQALGEITEVLLKGHCDDCQQRG